MQFEWVQGITQWLRLVRCRGAGIGVSAAFWTGLELLDLPIPMRYRTSQTISNPWGRTKQESRKTVRCVFCLMRLPAPLLRGSLVGYSVEASLTSYKSVSNSICVAGALCRRAFSQNVQSLAVCVGVCGIGSGGGGPSQADGQRQSRRTESSTADGSEGGRHGREGGEESDEAQEQCRVQGISERFAHKAAENSRRRALTLAKTQR